LKIWKCLRIVKKVSVSLGDDEWGIGTIEGVAPDEENHAAVDHIYSSP
jgi:hypothetical protein